MTYICSKTGNYIDGGMDMPKKKNEEKPEVISTDPFGSYTGRPQDPNERPIQDADDL